jgi:hypothetical protein
MMEALQVLRFNQRNSVLDINGAFGDELGDLETVSLDEISDTELHGEVVRA